jgi:hypothetical protein
LLPVTLPEFRRVSLSSSVIRRSGTLHSRRIADSPDQRPFGCRFRPRGRTTAGSFSPSGMRFADRLRSVRRLRLLMPIRSHPASSARCSSASSWASHKNVEALGARHLPPATQFFLGESGDNQQNRIGAVGAGFDDLEFVDDEILAQTGKRTTGGEASRK